MKNPNIKVIDPGHAYEIASQTKISKLVIAFVKGEKGHVHDGITNEDLLAVLIDRMEFLNEGKFHCIQNDEAIASLKSALTWLEARTADRIERDVEGTNKK